MSSLLGDPEIEELFSPEKLLGHMLQVEVEVASIQARIGQISNCSARQIAKAAHEFEPDVARLTRSTERDGVVVPELVKQLREKLFGPACSEIHFGLTSQDIIDTTLAMAISELVPLLVQRLSSLLGSLDRLNADCGSKEINGYTRMQLAKPIKFGHRIGMWQALLVNQRKVLENRGKQAARVQLAGPVGTGQELGCSATLIRSELAATLSLNSDDQSWQTNRLALAEFASACCALSSSTGKVGKDLALMAQLGEVGFVGGGSSSSMPHKSNPVGAETMIALGHYAAVLLPGMHNAVMHEQERSGAMWTLEWIIFPQICLIAGKSLSTAERAVSAIRFKR